MIMVLFCYSWLLCHRKLQLNPWNTKALLPPKNTVVSEEHGRVIGNEGFRLLNVTVVQESGEVRKELQLGEMWEWRGNLKGAGFTHLNKLLHSKRFCCATLCQDSRWSQETMKTFWSGEPLSVSQNIARSLELNGKWERNGEKRHLK